MPTYAFICEQCGPFEIWRSFAEASDPARCPACGGAGRRVWTPPGIVRTAPWKRRALNLEEQSAHEPGVVSAPRGRPMRHRHRHGATPPWAVAGH